jgi:hypothetical protein
LNRVPGNEVDQQEYDADDQPDYGQGVEDALEEQFQFSVLLFVDFYILPS